MVPLMNITAITVASMRKGSATGGRSGAKGRWCGERCNTEPAACETNGAECERDHAAGAPPGAKIQI